MQQFSSTNVKGHWGEISDAAMREPVAITRHGRPALVVTSVQDYQELQQLRYERLKMQVQVGFQQLERGEHSELSMDEIKALARRELDEQQAANAPD